MVKITSDKGDKPFRNTEEAAEWLLVTQPGIVKVNGVDVTDECDWTEYGVALGVLDYAIEYGEEDTL